MAEQQLELNLVNDNTNDNLLCHLGWYYDPERTTTKTGQIIKKRPTYRLSTKHQNFTLGDDALNVILNQERDFVLFFDDDNWQRLNTLLQTSLEKKQFTNWHYTQTESLQTELKPLNNIPTRSVLRTMLSDFWNWLLGKE